MSTSQKKKKLQQKTALLPQALSDWKCLLSQPFAVNLPLGWCYLNLKFTTFRFRQAKPGAFRPRARWVKPLKFRCSIMPEVKTPWSPQWNLRRCHVFFRKHGSFVTMFGLFTNFWERKNSPGFRATYKKYPLENSRIPLFTNQNLMECHIRFAFL